VPYLSLRWMERGLWLILAVLLWVNATIWEANFHRFGKTERMYVGTGLLRATPGSLHHILIGFDAVNVSIELPPGGPEKMPDWYLRPVIGNKGTAFPYTVFVADVRQTVNGCYAGGELVYAPPRSRKK